MIILIHSSKTMRPAVENSRPLSSPLLANDALLLANMLKQLNQTELMSMMKVSPKLADSTKQLLNEWSNQSSLQRAAVDSFLGDIYSGLQSQNWDAADKQYAQKNLRILSGLYGLLKPFDAIYPYRLEMGYKIPNQSFKNMYEFWSDKIASSLPIGELILNLTAVEYSSVVTKYVRSELIISPRFLTINPKTSQPIFVAVHAKIARGAFANWCIKNRVSDTKRLNSFKEIGYSYEAELSDANTPAYVCKEFGGLGLSVRLT